MHMENVIKYEQASSEYVTFGKLEMVIHFWKVIIFLTSQKHLSAIADEPDDFGGEKLNCPETQLKLKPIIRSQILAIFLWNLVHLASTSYSSEGNNMNIIPLKVLTFNTFP